MKENSNTSFNSCWFSNSFNSGQVSKKTVKIKFNFSLFNENFSIENLNEVYTNNKFLYEKCLNNNIEFLKSIFVERNILLSRPDILSECFVQINNDYFFFMKKYFQRNDLTSFTKELLIDRIIEFFVLDMRTKWFRKHHPFLKHLSFKFLGKYYGLDRKRNSASFFEKKQFYILLLKDIVFRNYSHKKWKNRNFLFLLDLIYKNKTFDNNKLLLFFLYNLFNNYIFLINNKEFLKFYKVFIFFLVKEQKLNKIYLKNFNFLKNLTNLDIFFLKNLFFEHILNDFLMFFEQKYIFSLINNNSWNKKKEISKKIIEKKFNFKNFLIESLNLDLKYKWNFFNFNATTLAAVVNNQITWNWLLTFNVDRSVNSESSYVHVNNFYDLFYYLNIKLFFLSQNDKTNNSFTLNELNNKLIEDTIDPKLPYYAKGPWIRTDNNTTRIYLICYYVNLIPDDWFLKNKEYLNNLHYSLTNTYFNVPKLTVKYLRKFFADYFYTMHRKQNIKTNNNFLKLLSDSLNWTYKEEYIYFKVFDELKGPIPSYFYGTNYLVLKFFYLLLTEKFVFDNDIFFINLNNHRNKLYKCNEFHFSDTTFFKDLNNKDLYYLDYLVTPGKNVFLSCLYEDFLFEITSFHPNVVPNQERFKSDTILLPNLQWDEVEPFGS